MTERATHLKLAVDVGSDPITGSVSVGTGTPTTFCGWIDLVAAIEAARHSGGVAAEDIPTSVSSAATSLG